MMIEFVRQPRAGIDGASARPGGDVGDGRDEIGGVAGGFGGVKFFGEPRPAAVRGLLMLISDAPAAVAAFDDVNPFRGITVIAIVVAGEKIAEFVEDELLRIAQAGCE